jgi:hypothetical protein
VPVERKMTKTKKKIPNKRKLELECDKLWSQCIIARDKTCRYYNNQERLSAHHIRSRTHKTTRWDLNNGICLSWRIHFLQKANPERFQDVVIEIIGENKYQSLKRKSLEIYDYDAYELELIRNDLKKKLKEFEAGYDNLPF